MQESEVLEDINSPAKDADQLMRNLKAHMTLIRANDQFSTIKKNMRALSKQPKFFYYVYQGGHSLLSVAVEALNVFAVREILLQGVDPNKISFPLRSFEVGIFSKALDMCKQIGPDNVDKYRRCLGIVELLWIHKARIPTPTDIPNGTDLQTQQEAISALYPGLINFERPSLGLCYAVHSAAALSRRPGADQGKLLLAKITKRLNGNSYELYSLVSAELSRFEQTSYLGQRSKVSLTKDHFQTDLLRAIARDPALLKGLRLKAPSPEALDASLEQRNTFREQLIQRLDDWVNESSYIVESGQRPGPKLPHE